MQGSLVAGMVDTKLDSHGTVLIGGELCPHAVATESDWRQGCLVKLVGTPDHVLIVRLQD